MLTYPVRLYDFPNGYSKGMKPTEVVGFFVTAPNPDQAKIVVRQRIALTGRRLRVLSTLVAGGFAAVLLPQR